MIELSEEDVVGLSRRVPAVYGGEPTYQCQVCWALYTGRREKHLRWHASLNDVRFAVEVDIVRRARWKEAQS